ncbi:hypothetical protein [Kitasatospora sp. NPDC090091]|uniref:hypothetical protein n=1 Tax=Kitasatospora sp. NPDC090091 TaxID=3364081 RepID=UPI00382A8967
MIRLGRRLGAEDGGHRLGVAGQPVGRAPAVAGVVPVGVAPAVVAGRRDGKGARPGGVDTAGVGQELDQDGNAGAVPDAVI